MQDKAKTGINTTLFRKNAAAVAVVFTAISTACFSYKLYLLAPLLDNYGQYFWRYGGTIAMQVFLIFYVLKFAERHTKAATMATTTTILITVML